MAFPIGSNIFTPGSPAQAYLAQFPLQVAVLFTELDVEFAMTLRRRFLEIDRMTGRYVAFVAVVDPPADWLDEARLREWWQTYRESIGEAGFSIDKISLVSEVARLLGVTSMPAIVVAQRLWSGEQVISGSNADSLFLQFQTLTEHVRRRGRVDTDEIKELLYWPGTW